MLQGQVEKSNKLVETDPGLGQAPQADWRPMVNVAFERFFRPDLPTRTIVEVAALSQRDTIQVDVIASRMP